MESSPVGISSLKYLCLKSGTNFSFSISIIGALMLLTPIFEEIEAFKEELSEIKEL